MDNSYDKQISTYIKQLEKLVASASCDLVSENRKQIPKAAGIYIIFAKNQGLLYIGQSHNLRRRLISDHIKGDRIGSAFRRNLANNKKLKTEKEITSYICNSCYCKYMMLDNPKHLEYFAISVLKPKLNR